MLNDVGAPPMPAAHAQYEGSDPAGGKTGGMLKQRGPADGGETVGPAATPAPIDYEPIVHRSNDSLAVSFGGPSNDETGSDASAGEQPDCLM